MIGWSWLLPGDKMNPPPYVYDPECGCEACLKYGLTQPEPIKSSPLTDEEKASLLESNISESGDET
jgi:hypothetical protein